MAPPLQDRLKRLLSAIVSGARHILPRTPETPRVDETRVRELVAKAEAVFHSRVDELARRVAADEISPMQFRAQFLVELRYYLITSAAIGAGGVGNLRQEDLALVDHEMREQAGYLDRWVADVERKPTESRSANGMANRAKQYGGSGHRLAEQVSSQSRYREFPPLPYFPKQKTLCKNGCKCTWKWTNVDREKGNADVVWALMASAEHCETCVKRQQYGPIKYRGFQIVNLPPNLQDFFAT